MTQFDISNEQRAALLTFRDALTDAIPGILDASPLNKFFLLCDCWKVVSELFSLEPEQERDTDHEN